MKQMMWCVESPEGLLSNFYSNIKSAEMCLSKGDKVVQVCVSEDKHENPEYYGWLDLKDNQYCYIYSQLFMVSMCFPYGSRVEEEKGKGKLVGIKVIKKEEV